MILRSSKKSGLIYETIAVKLLTTSTYAMVHFLTLSHTFSGIPLGKGSKKMIVSGAESCYSIQYTSNAWALVVVEDSTKLERDVWHSFLDGDRESWTAGLGMQNLCVVHVDDGLAATASGTSRSCSGATSRASD